ncbi:inhibitor of nuclear factor kappa-B kinase subunit alpha [Penaeus vannamei]|uniref:inhibitor of nuclear factor kappa-B kinase subunit alpha n=1 Tax=Penaeus vannamei TaxID=6689 RepID=UPI000F682E87|nr:inhibitor of nuclear factor kappa-B kinase subunit alpha-like [Penaeus vannamei]XP_027227428.1 inhibitor of nuclear factor kappa-B kinase subunit alpha-like [Penaeus vannamei]
MAAAEDRPPTYPWLKDKVLGTGGFGTVTLWRHNDTGETIALKKCRWGTPGTGTENILTPKHVERWEKEVEIMNRLNHQAVVRCFPVPDELTGPQGDLPMLCMEYCSGGDLRKVLNKPENCCGLREAAVRSCIRDMTEAVAYLHSMRIIHRDLKPENIVLQDVDGKTVYKLIDLGYAKELEQSSVCTSFVGTLQYLAPELFLSKRYTCTVDYWSLGLVTHEIITGIRPFLPNMTPVEWMKRVRTKQSHHVCVYEGRNGEIQFSSHMFPECHISQPLRTRIEEWLRIMLEWDPVLRGQVLDEDSAKQFVAFNMINDILNKKMIKVFVVDLCRLLEYEVTESTSLSEVQQWVARDSGVLVDDQRPLLPRGQPPDPTRPAIQCWAPPDEDEWLLYIFAEGMTRPQVPPHFPPLVEAMLREPRTAVEYQTQRRMWAHAVFFLHREARLLTLLTQAQKVSMLHLMSGHAQLTKTGQRMLSDIAKLQARHHLFMEALNTDLDYYDEQASSGRLTSEKLYSGWREMGEVTLRQVHAVVERVQQLEGSLTALNTRILELQCSPFARARAIDSLDSVLTAGEDHYCNLRRRNKEQRATPHDNTDMCKLLLQALRKRDRLQQDLYKHVEKQSECCSEVAALSSPLEAVLQDAARTAQHISSLQKQRQKDIWKIMEIAINHSRTVGTAAGMVQAPQPVPNASQLPKKPPSPAVLSSLNNLLEKSKKESDAIIAENRALRCQMVEMLSGNVNSNLVIGAARSPTALSPPVTADGLMLPPALPDKRTPSPTSQAALNKKAVETSL